MWAPQWREIRRRCTLPRDVALRELQMRANVAGRTLATKHDQYERDWLRSAATAAVLARALTIHSVLSVENWVSVAPDDVPGRLEERGAPWSAAVEEGGQWRHFWEVLRVMQAGWNEEKRRPRLAALVNTKEKFARETAALMILSSADEYQRGGFSGTDPISTTIDHGAIARVVDSRRCE